VQTDLAAGPSRRALALLAVVVAAMVVAASFAVIEVRHASAGRSLSHDRTSVAAIAGQYAVDFTSVNYQTMQADAKVEAKHATAAFAQVYLATVEAFGPIYTKGQVVETTSVKRTGLVSLGSTSAIVIVALVGKVDAVKDSKTLTQTILPRIRITLTKVKGQWLLSNLAKI
jgi:Mce-associated membrane protein